MARKLSHSERVVSKVGKRPVSATQVGQKLGYPDHRGVARTLKMAADQGKIVRRPDGKYQSA